ncbi:MAG: hypothetical protein JWM62_359 [Frankiales bacterium]|jgi:prepilin-type N-terminal cleavage/methylation domain-containing protein|nr:hypothetical protein [Frankiales bacterium]
MSRSLWHRPRPAGDAGMTMTELSASMLVLGIVLSAVATLVYGAGQLTSRNDARLDQVNQARQAMEAMSRTLRTAVLPSQLGATCSAAAMATDPNCAKAAFVQGTASSVQFFANIDNESNTIGPSKVSYTLNNGSLVETIQRPDAHAANVYSYSYCAPGPTCPVRTRTLARGVRSDAALFTYYDAAAVALTRTVLTAADLERVDSMEIRVSVQRSGKVQARPTTFVQRVALPNADAVVRFETT